MNKFQICFPVLPAIALVALLGCNRSNEPAVVVEPANSGVNIQGSPVVDVKSPPTPNPKIAAPGREDPYQRLLRSVAWVKTGRGSGTGWIIDVEQKLIVTNDHVVRLQDNAVSLMPLVVFPVYGDPAEARTLIQERRHYQDKLTELGLPGKLIYADQKRDLAIIQLTKLPDGAHELPLASQSPAPGDEIHSVGNPGRSDALWVYTKGAVRSVHRKKWYNATQFLRFDARVVETQSPTNPGDSGGPVINNKGELVAVNNAVANGARLLSYAIDVGEVRAFLEETRLVLVDPQTLEETDWKRAQALLQRGIAHRVKGQYSAAMADFREVERYSGANGFRLIAARLNLELGIAFCLRDQSPQTTGEQIPDKALAEAYLIRANEIDPKLVEAYEWRAKANPPGGSNWAKVIELEPDNYDAYCQFAKNATGKEQISAAVESMEKAIALQPDRADAWYWRGHVKMYVDQELSAFADFAKAAELDPYNADYVARLARLAEHLRSYEQAINAYEHLIRLHPQDARGYLGRGCSRQEQARLLEQRGDVLRAKELHNLGVDDLVRAQQLDKTLALSAERLRKR